MRETNIIERVLCIQSMQHEHNKKTLRMLTRSKCSWRCSRQLLQGWLVTSCTDQTIFNSICSCRLVCQTRHLCLLQQLNLPEILLQNALSKHSAPQNGLGVLQLLQQQPHCWVQYESVMSTRPLFHFPRSYPELSHLQPLLVQNNMLIHCATHHCRFTILPPPKKLPKI